MIRILMMLLTVGPAGTSGQTDASRVLGTKTDVPLPHIEVWHGDDHRVGHLGDAQDDSHVLGHVYSKYSLASFCNSVNGGDDKPLDIIAYRRIVAHGDFNADIPIHSLRVGVNTVTPKAIHGRRDSAVTLVTQTRIANGEYPLPANIRWSSALNPEDVGQYSDGQWDISPDCLRTTKIGYDRVFLVGNKTSKECQFTCKVTIHAMRMKTGPQSSVVRAVRFCMRWSGHSLEDNSPADQPK
jgi:hypothetical protein